jgi:hypothetical protein
MGQPSRATVFSSELFPPISSIFCAVDQAVNCGPAAAAAGATRIATIPTASACLMLKRMVTPFLR